MVCITFGEVSQLALSQRMSIRPGDASLPKLSGGPSICALFVIFFVCTLVPVVIILFNGLQSIFDLSGFAYDVHAGHQRADVAPTQAALFSADELALMKDFLAGNFTQSRQELQILRILVGHALRSR